MNSFFAAGGHSLLVPQLLDRNPGPVRGGPCPFGSTCPTPPFAGLSGLVDGKLVSAMSVTDKVMGEKT